MQADDEEKMEVEECDEKSPSSKRDASRPMGTPSTLTVR